MNNHSETLKIKKVIGDYIEGTYKADTDMLKGVFHEKAVMNGYLGPQCIMATPAVFIEDMASEPSMKEKEAKYHGEIESIYVQEKVAAVVVSETGFRGDGSLVNFFHLINIDGEWKIVSKLFTTL